MKMQQKLSPQQLMLMQMLQMPVTSLDQMLKEEMEKNPLLEVNTAGDEAMESLPDENGGEEALTDADDDDYSYRERQERDRNQSRAETVYVAEESLVDRLVSQLTLRSLTDRQRAIAQELIGSLDDAGYLSRDVDLVANDLAFTQGIEVSREEVLEVLEVLQSDGSDATRWATAVVDDCFDLFVKRNYDRIMERLALDEEQLHAALERIQRLNPKPAGGESEAPQAHYIVPDFIVTRQDDTLQLTLNDRRLPQLQLNRYYQEMLQQMQALAHPSAADKETIEFLRSKTDSANLLVDTLKQRHVTMWRVMQVILKRQRRYFLTGDSADLRPLLQKDVAEESGYDISTISRVVNSKYVQTEFGTFLLKDCFSQSITTDSGEEVATESVRQELQSLVDHEDKRDPLTDDALARLLTDKGYPVARRTVAKYREMLGIPIGRMRRQLKMLLVLVATLAISGLVMAQQPRKESYYDSLINAQIREGKAKARAAEAKDNAKKGGKVSTDKARPALEIHEPEPEPTAIDTALANGDDLIDVIYDASLPPPSALWYGRNLSGAKVRSPSRISSPRLTGGGGTDPTEAWMSASAPATRCAVPSTGWSASPAPWEPTATSWWCATTTDWRRCTAIFPKSMSSRFRWCVPARHWGWAAARAAARVPTCISKCDSSTSRSTPSGFSISPTTPSVPTSSTLTRPISAFASPVAARRWTCFRH